MKKIIFTVLIMIFLISCTKEKKTCTNVQPVNDTTSLIDDTEKPLLGTWKYDRYKSNGTWIDVKSASLTLVFQSNECQGSINPHMRAKECYYHSSHSSWRSAGYEYIMIGYTRYKILSHTTNQLVLQANIVDHYYIK